MSINLDSQIITIPCPVCQKEFSEALGRVKNGQQIKCASCGVPFTLDADKLADITRIAEKGLDKFLSNLPNFKKRS